MTKTYSISIAVDGLYATRGKFQYSEPDVAPFVSRAEELINCEYYVGNQDGILWLAIEDDEDGRDEGEYGRLKAKLAPLGTLEWDEEEQIRIVNCSDSAAILLIPENARSGFIEDCDAPWDDAIYTAIEDALTESEPADGQIEIEGKTYSWTLTAEIPEVEEVESAAVPEWASALIADMIKREIELAPAQSLEALSESQTPEEVHMWWTKGGRIAELRKWRRALQEASGAVVVPK